MEASTQLRMFIQCLFSILPLIYSVTAEDCTFGKYDLSALHAFSPWSERNDNLKATFEISLCSPLTTTASAWPNNCPDGTHICAHYDDGKAISYGRLSDDTKLDDTEKGENGELLLMYTADQCSTVPEANYSSFFYFKCGKTLGHPRHVGDFPCYTHFEWESYIFCKDLPVPEKEVPCTVVTKDHLHMIDLSPLTKVTGAYLVNSDPVHNNRIYINVCRDITSAGNVADDPLKKCPKGAAACQVVNDASNDFGQPTKELEATDDGARLSYTGSEANKPAHCTSPMTTTINFRCPDRGGSKDPQLLSDFYMTCAIEIDWVTEFACPVETIASDTCQLTMTQHNIDIDLSPLKHDQFKSYVVDVNDGTDHYKYYINVCDGLHTSCGSDLSGAASVCQRKVGDDAFSNSVGSKSFTKLRYSDNQLTMVIKNGDSCHTNFRRQTTIDFICNKTAVNDGEGQPEFVSHDNCSYFFVWGTKHACVDSTIDDTCSVLTDNGRFDLSPLVREKGNNWEVMTGETEGDGLTYYLNVCHDVLASGAASGCPHGAALCASGKSGSFNLGKYKQPLTYDKASNSLRLSYTDGEKTQGGCVKETMVNLFCSPGNAEGVPQLVHRSEDECYYEIEWHTSAACILSHKTGTNCQIYDNDAGYTFDLNILKQPKGYTVDTKDYTYLINVCAAVDDGAHCTTSPHNNAAICQIRKDNNGEMKIASPSTNLEYYNGILNLTYTDGEPYNDDQHTPRQAEIAFVCDVAAGKGSPEFLEEKDSTYAFEWRTAYVCPVLPVECAITVDNDKGHQQFDLSRLAKETSNWEIEDTSDPDNIKKFYINVCRPVVPIQEKIPTVVCSPRASICATNRDKSGKETLFHGNLGRSETSPQLETSISGVKLTYTNGDLCTDSDGTKKNFKTTIHFDCIPGKVAGGPSTPRLTSQCEYSILWPTEAACAVDAVTETEASASNCTLKDPNSDFVFNLEPLAEKDGYEVKTDSKTYKLNICGPLKDDACGKFDDKYASAVCESSTSKAMVKGSSLEYTSEGEMTLIYKGGFDQAKGIQHLYVLNLLCDRKAQKPVISFDSDSIISTTFKVRTALACPPQPVSCTVEGDTGKRFDLSPLARETGNWVVIDTREDHADLRYHINVCRPVNPDAGMTCPGGAVGGCQTSTSGTSNFNLGYVQSEPVVSTVGDALTLHYDGGDKCHVGKEMEAYRSTRIIFYCDAVEHDPVFDSESETCEYFFFWRTPSACPQQIVRGSDCKVTDPLYGNEYDLTPLRKTSGHYSVTGSEYTYLINACGNIGSATAPCDATDTGACQTGDTLKSPVVAGKFSDKVEYDSGRISLTYSGGKDSCHGKYERKTVIDFVCHQDQSGQDGPVFLEEKADCTYWFEWSTKLACPPHRVTDCTLQDGDLSFDLSRLSLADGNYEKESKENNETFIINVCRSLVHKKGQTCPHQSAACRIDMAETDAKKKFHSIGNINSQSLTYNRDTKTLVLRYDNGQTCESSKERRSTVILFQCDENSDALGSPGGHFTLNDCEDHFVWISSAACPLTKTTKQPDTDKDFGDCRVKNPSTGYEFDLSSLKKSEGYETSDRVGDKYNLNVCGAIADTSKCGDGTGVCQSSMVGGSAFNAGKANARLAYKEGGVLELVYKDGDRCRKSGVGRTTHINFVCQPGAGEGRPVFIDMSADCLFYFDWHTDLACEKQVVCSVDTPSGYTLDFSSLIKKSGKYNVIPSRAGGHQPAGLIYVNLCRPLNPIFETLCPAGSGACLIHNDDKPLSLGHIDGGPVYDAAHKQTKITYPNGDPCSSNPAVNITSEIILTCGTDEYSEPVEEGLSSDCKYVFLWETPLACETKHTQPLSANCTVFDYSTQATYDLLSLSDVSEVVSSHGGKYKLQPCGGLQEKGDSGQSLCAGAGVCLTGSGDKDGSYGAVSHGMFEIDPHYFVQLTLSQGRECGGGRAMSTIYFECERAAGKGVPVVVDDDDKCQVTFRWRTSLVCPPQKEECVVAMKDSLYDMTYLSQDTGSWNYTDKDKNIYWLNLCQTVHGNALTSGCSPSAAVCRKSSNGEVRMLGRLDSQRMAVSAGMISVMYGEGDADVCESSRRRRSNISPKVIIKLSCGTTTGTPVLTSVKHDDCVFEFSWKSKLACAVGSVSKPLTVQNGKVHDWRTGKDVDLNPILARRDNVELNIDNKKYLINIGRSVGLDHSVPGSLSCSGASVCLITPASNTYRNIGTFSTGAFYMEDDRFEVVFTSPELCSGKKKMNVSTTITFSCKPGETQVKPEFLYKSSDCAYVFNWDTEVVCETIPLVKPGTEDTSGDQDKTSRGAPGSGGAGHTKIVIGVSVLLAVVLACVLVLILHKPERRAVVGSKLKRLVICRRNKDSPIIYSKLNAEDDLNMDDDPFNPFDEPDEENEINTSSLPARVSVTQYHDDSDEDLLL